MARSVYLQPKSMDMPVQGDWEFFPVFKLLEDTTMAGLQAQLNVDVGIQSQSAPDYYVIEEIEYQVTLVKAMPQE